MSAKEASCVIGKIGNVKTVPASLSERRALTAIIASGLVQGTYKDADPSVVAARAVRIAEAIEEKVK